MIHGLGEVAFAHLYLGSEFHVLRPNDKLGMIHRVDEGHFAWFGCVMHGFLLGVLANLVERKCVWPSRRDSHFAALVLCHGS